MNNSIKNIQNRKGNLLLFVLIVLLLSVFIQNRGCKKENKSPADYVNPFIGTDAGGHTFPGACRPGIFSAQWVFIRLLRVKMYLLLEHLFFEMGPEPNKNWGNSSDAFPPSMTD